MTGAALATAAAATLTTVAQVIELGLLERVWLRLRCLYKPLLGMVPLLAVLLMAGDPARADSLAMRCFLGLGLAFGFILLMAAMRHEEVLSISKRLYNLTRPRRAP
jgi:hypothetical protein